LSLGKNWKTARECWAILIVEKSALALDPYGDPIAFESVEEAKVYCEEEKIISKDIELATTREEAKRGGVKAIIIPVRVLTRSL
jgi:viroplasmin and RNaseH domain-containing protein